jgi:16S rRNA (uracil1498-N3)-methyltransferase
MHTAYQPDLEESKREFVLSEEESFHFSKVLRASEGSELILANGQGLKAIAKVVRVHHKNTLVLVSEFSPLALKTNQEIHLAIAPTKNLERIEWLVEKGTEMGLDKISLLKCKNNERPRVNLERLNKIALSAFKQSKRAFLPTIIDIEKIETFVEQNSKGYIAHCYRDIIDLNPNTTLGQTFLDGPILIGPEGDFSVQEVEHAMKNGYQTLSLGANRLRTETAGILAIASQCLQREIQ